MPLGPRRNFMKAHIQAWTPTEKTVCCCCVIYDYRTIGPLMRFRRPVMMVSLQSTCGLINYKTAELSQRRPRDAPNIWVPWKVSRVLTIRTRLLFPKFGLLFRSILRMCVQNLKFVALPVFEIIGGTQKIWAVTGYAHALYSPKFLKGFCSYGPAVYTCQVWSS